MDEVSFERCVDRLGDLIEGVMKSGKFPDLKPRFEVVVSEVGARATSLGAPELIVRANPATGAIIADLRKVAGARRSGRAPPSYPG